MIPQYTFTINLPTGTSKEVIDWFDYMNNAKQLSVELIELVYNNLKSGNNKSIFNYGTIDEPNNNISGKQSDIQDTLINNIYKWQESTCAVFKETNAIKKEKKKMLSI